MPARFGPALVASVLAVLSAWAAAGTAAACGGSVSCQCGDTVSVNYALMRDLGPCPGHGLIVKSNVILDCQGSRITGLGNGSEQYGIFLNGKPGAEVTGATIKNCRVSGFLRGIRLRAARGNTISGNVATGNGNQRTHEGYGIDVSGASPGNLFEGNQVHGSADEGIHIGYGSHRNRLVGNLSSDNHRENLYVLGADGGVFQRNTLGGGGSNSVYVKDSSLNRFEGNTFIGQTLRIIGNAHDNDFVDNTFSGAGLHFTEYREQALRSPSNNRVRGGKFTGVGECVRFTSSSGNVLTDLPLGDCGTAVRGDSRSGPSRNTLVGEAPPAKIVLDEASTLDLGFPVTVEVRDAAGAPVPGAQVRAQDASGATAFTVVTDEAGTIAPQIVISATRKGDQTIPRPPGTLTVAKSGYATATQLLPTSGPAKLDISLAPQP